MKKDLNIGFYLPNLNNAEKSGSLSFFNFLTKEFFNYKANKGRNLFIIYESFNDIENINSPNLQLLELPCKKTSLHLTCSQKVRLRLGSWISKLAKYFDISLNISPMINNGLSDQVNGANKQKIIEELFDNHDLDLLIYANQFEIPTTNRPYIWILWDMGCKTINFFHHMEQSHEIQEKLKFAAHNAFRIITGSREGAFEINKFLNFPAERIRTIPFPVPSDLQSCESTQPNQELVPYLFYPALLTPFKNHAVILEALRILHDRKQPLHFVMTGVNKGNLEHILHLAKELEIENFVHYLGSVSLEDLKGLYQNAVALVFPSLLGPNNFPPIEAMALGVPCIVSNIKGHLDQLEDNALFFDPLNPVSLAERVEELLNDSTLRTKLIKKGKDFTHNLTPKNYLKELLLCAEEFLPYRKNWSKFRSF